MALTHTYLDLTIRLHLSGNVVMTTQALSDPPRPELISLAVDGLSLLDYRTVTNPQGERVPREVELGLTPTNPTEDRYARFIENLLTALNGEAEEALVDSAEGGE